MGGGISKSTQVLKGTTSQTAVRHTRAAANRHHQHTAWVGWGWGCGWGGGDLLIQSSLLGDPSSYLLLYSWSRKPSEGGKTPLYPLCRLAKKKKIQKTENIPEKEREAEAKHRERGEKMCQSDID